MIVRHSGIYFVLVMATAAAGMNASAQPCQVHDPELQLNYRGGCHNGLAHGEGVARGEYGAYYQGSFENGYKSGYGVKLYANGDAYAGDWKQDYRDGTGTYTYGEQSPWRGDHYTGQWARDARHGRGSYQFHPTGETFTADWNMGQTDAFASPLLIRRQRAAQALIPTLGQPGTPVCSTLTDGASPQRIARGTVTAVQDDRIQVHVATTDVLAHSQLSLNPRWDVITEWMICTP